MCLPKTPKVEKTPPPPAPPAETPEQALPERPDDQSAARAGSEGTSRLRIRRSIGDSLGSSGSGLQIAR